MALAKLVHLRTLTCLTLRSSLLQVQSNLHPLSRLSDLLNEEFITLTLIFSKMGVKSLPAEIWIYIFHLVLDDTPFDDFSLPTSMSESSWQKMVYGNWTLRTPQESFNVVLRQRYSLLKVRNPKSLTVPSLISVQAITTTCKSWREIGAESMFRYLFFGNPRSLQRLCAVYDSDHYLGQWTRRLHMTRYYAGGGHTMEEMQNALISIIRHCPNLQIFVIDWPMTTSFTPVADALCTYCSSSIRTIHISIQSDHLAHLIWTLDTLPALVSVHIEFNGIPEEGIHLGAASGLALTLNISQLSLRGFSADFIEQATSWKFPQLQTLALDYINYRDDFPDLMEFLENVGGKLTDLDVNCIPTQDVASILDLCPLLSTFAFNPDWRLPINPGTSTSILVSAPHENLVTIGCHQLLHAFGVGYAATYARHDPIATQYIRRSNDLNFASLTKANFPKLERIRVLNRSLLRDLETSNGPDDVCYERWERWSTQCARQQIRLEDCTGADLGYLPSNSDDEDDEGDDEEEEEEEADGLVHVAQDPLTMIRDVLEECRRATGQPSAGGYGSYGNYMQAY